MQQCDASDFRGKHIMLSGYVKSEDVKEWAGLWMRIDACGKVVGFDNMQNRPITGDSDWQRCEIVLYVPHESDNIAFGVLLQGDGSVWLDDFDFKVVDGNVCATGYENRSCGIQYQQKEPTNLDFNEGFYEKNPVDDWDTVPRGWFVQRTDKSVFVGLANETEEGSAVACIRSTSESEEAQDGWGALLQAVDASEYVGKRVRLSAKVKTNGVELGAGLWLRIDAGWDLAVCYDYMDDRKIKGDTDWTEHNCVIDIPENGDNIYFGGLLAGAGEMFIKDFSLDIVTSKTRTTGANGSVSKQSNGKSVEKKQVNAVPTNLEFAGQAKGLPEGWIARGSHPERFQMAIDPKVKCDGKPCAIMKAKARQEDGFGTLMQNVEPAAYRGKRVRFSAQVKTEGVDHAALWMRVDGPAGEYLAFDNMQDTPIIGTNDWAYYEIVVDVAHEAENLAFGVLMTPEGTTWISKVALETVSNDVETTDAKNMKIGKQRNAPINLKFEEAE
jgi:hypothetical protein